VTAPTTLRVYPGADGDFTLYDDDGISQAYLSGDAAFTRIRWNDRMRMLTVEPDERYRSSRARLTRNFDVVLMPGGAPQRVHFAGHRAQVRL
jgi:alpha-glucosidase (family GH31 glycosyl hydrolase)